MPSIATIQDITKEEDATSDLVRTKAGLLFEQPVVEQIIGLLEGTTVYTYTSPALATLTINVPDTLSKKLKYSNQKDATPPTASIQVTGILTDTEETQAKALSTDPRLGQGNRLRWQAAFAFLQRCAVRYFP